MKKKRTAGQGLVEYALLLTLVAVGVTLTLGLFGISLRDVYCSISEKISGGEGCAPPAEGTRAVKICEDDFSMDASGWNTLQGSKSKVQDGKLCPPNYALMLNQCSASKNLEDYTVSLNGANLTVGNGYGLVFRAENTKNGMTGYVFQYDPGYYPGSFIIRKWANGRELSKPIAAAKASDYYWYNVPRDVKVVVEGDVFTAYVDGAPVVTAQDSTYLTGGAGIRTWDSTQVCFDQFDMEITR